MTPIEKIERLARQQFKTTSQCGKELRKVADKRKAFVETVVNNAMVDGLVISCKR